MDFPNRILPDGREALVMPMLFGVGRLCVGEPGQQYFEDMWCYPTVAAALVALANWDGTGEPDGWHRHPTSGRRRPECDAAKEYVYA
jgi:hypothetical protein